MKFVGGVHGVDEYEVEITETLSRVIKVKANSPEEAIENIIVKYKNEEIVLDYNDYKGYEVNLCESNS